MKTIVQQSDNFIRGILPLKPPRAVMPWWSRRLDPPGRRKCFDMR